MLIGVAGPACAGKAALVAHLVRAYGCEPLRLRRRRRGRREGGVGAEDGSGAGGGGGDGGAGMSADEVLELVTPRWTQHFVVYPVEDSDTVARLRARPFFLLVAVDAPVLLRFRRARAR